MARVVGPDVPISLENQPGGMTKYHDCGSHEHIGTSSPSRWQTTSAVEGGGVDLRVLSSGRSYIVVGAIVLAGFSGWITLAHYVSSGSGSAPLLGLTVFFSLLALWCALGDERWHVEQNCLGTL